MTCPYNPKIFQMSLNCFRGNTKPLRHIDTPYIRSHPNHIDNIVIDILSDTSTVLNDISTILSDIDAVLNDMGTISSDISTILSDILNGTSRFSINTFDIPYL